MSSLRTYSATAVIAVFISFFFFSGLRNALRAQNVFPFAGLTLTDSDHPGLSLDLAFEAFSVLAEYSPDIYVPLRTLSEDYLALGMVSHKAGAQDLFIPRSTQSACVRSRRYTWHARLAIVATLLFRIPGSLTRFQ